MLQKRILDIASKHPEFDKDVATAELNVLEELNLIDNFFEVCQKVKDGESNKINSSLAYYMGVTNVKPIGTIDIQKRRAYGRSGFPDIDMDFDYERRHEIIEYIINKYGRENVGNIGTRQKLKIKASVRRAIKVLDPTNSVRYDENKKEIKSVVNENFILENEILNELPKFLKKVDGSPVTTVEEACEEYPRFGAYMEKYPEIKRVASAIEGTMSGYGSHAAGIVVSPEPLSRISPLHVTTMRVGGSDGPQKVIATQFSMSDVEDLGLIKFDVLGVSTITAISWACKNIKEEHDIDIDWSKIPLDDADTLALLNSGRTDGCFQLEEHGMKECLKQIGIDSFGDIVVAIAMHRPGPMDYIPEFAGRKRGNIGVYYPHHLLKKITQSTFGILVYQEQIMQAFMDLADCTATDGYLFMKGCAKKKLDIINSCKEKFFKGCDSNGIQGEVVKKIWADLEKFGGYSFNRSVLFSQKILTTEQECSIKDLYNMKKRGDDLPQVFSQDGKTIDIVDVYDHGILSVYEIEFDDGSIVSSSLHHKFMTSIGVLPLGDFVQRNCSIVQYVKDNRKSLRIKNIKFVGYEQCYDLEVDSPDHLYCLANGVVNSNSHATSYAVESYKTGYLKTHYPAEFISARLSVETVRRNFEGVAKYERDAVKRFGFTILDSSLNESKVHWSIVSSADKIIRRPLLVKGLGIKIAEEIVRHQPYVGKDILHSFASKVGSCVGVRALDAMKNAGFWSGISKDKLLSDFEKIRRDAKRRRGRPDMDMFA